MNSIKVNLIENKKSQKPMRNILGINNIPRIYTKNGFVADCETFEVLNFKHIRFHDATIENPGQKIIDVSRIFPLFHLDDTMEENYFFLQTDDYLRYLENSTAEIDFRIGETIDHTGNGRLVGVPNDIDKWARICRNIVAHYINGEMNGMHLNITRVSVLEEPDNIKLFGGNVEQYSEMFCKLYKLIKADFPHVKVGGPNMMTSSLDFLASFLDICRKNHVKPDYISATSYTTSLEALKGHIESYKAIACEHGFDDIKFVFSEWHLGLDDWNRIRYISENGFAKTKSAAYSASALVDMIDNDFVEAVYYYAFGVSRFSFFDYRSEDNSLLPVFYGLKFFQSLAAECTQRIDFETDSSTDARILCAKTDDGKIRVLVSCYGSNDCRFEIAANECKKATLSAIADSSNHKPTEEKIEAQNGFFSINHTGQNGVYLLEIEAN